MGITITNIRNTKADQFDEVWAIVRSLKSPGKMKHVPVLSPSWNLFKQYLSLRDNGNWNENTFKTIYVPTFLREMCSPEAQAGLKAIIRAAIEKNIAAVCFCPDENTCHRSIVGGILQYYGVPVNGLNKDYSEYGRLYEQYLGKSLM